MRYFVYSVFLSAMIMFFVVPGFAQNMENPVEAAKQEAVKPANPIDEVVRLIDSEKLENYKKAIKICESILAKDPKNFDAAWLCAKAYREYGNEVKKQQAPGWADICAKYGKKGMEYAQKAIELAPDKPNGYLYYGLNVGIYSDGVGIITAVREGLKDKTQSNFEKAYKLDKNFEEGGPILSLGRFWQVVPWPFTDKKKALAYYREFQKTPFFKNSVEGHVYLAELLADLGSSYWGSNKNEKEVRKLLNEAKKLTNAPYWRKKIKEVEQSL